MEIFPLFQARLMLLCFLFGLLTGAVFDFFRAVSDGIGKRFRRVSYILLLISDIFTVTFMGLALVVLCFYYNKGIFRFFCLLGLALGLAFYFFAFSKIILKVYRWIFKVIFSALCIILLPMLKIIDKTRRNLQIISYCILKALAKLLIWVYNIYVKKYVKRRSDKGFLEKRKTRRQL